MNKNKQLKTMEESNKLIAEFMDYPTCSDYWKKDEGFQGEDYKDYYYVHGQYDQCYGSSNFHVNDMKFDLSWDWLMPVIEKITELCEEPQELDELKHALLCVDIKSVYFIVVEFIKEYNNGKN